MRRLVTLSLVIGLIGAVAAPAAAQAPTKTDQLLPGVSLTVEEVQPGVFRVVHDGARDLTTRNHQGIAVGHDGSVWLLRKHRFFRLGTPGGHRWAAGEYWTMYYDYHSHHFEVASDGTVWASERETGLLRTFDGEGWSTVRSQEARDGHRDHPPLTVAPDGGVWTAWIDPEGDATEHGRAWVVARLEGREWKPLDETLQSYVPPRLFITRAGDIWAAHVVIPRDDWQGQLLSRYVDGGWQRQSPGFGRHLFVDINGDGIVWLSSADGVVSGQSLYDNPLFLSDLLRFDGSEWHGFDPSNDERIRRLDIEIGNHHVLSAPDGAVWFKSARRNELPRLNRFDGTEVRSYFGGGVGVSAIDVAADGSVWVLADGDEGRELYVITPEAVARAE